MSRPFRFLVAMLPPAAAVIVACGPARSDTGDPETLTDATHLEGPSADPSASARAGGSKPAPPEAASSGLRVVERTDPPRTHVVDANGALVASFTRAARTVVVYGRTRTLRERDVAFPTADLPPLGADDGDGSSSPTRTHVAPPVTTTAWVRVLAQPYEGTMTTAHWAWLRERRDDASDDVLAIAYRFTTGGPKDAAYGPLTSTPSASDPSRVTVGRKEGADWNDYLGIAHTYADGTVDKPNLGTVSADGGAGTPSLVGSLDCSGFIRLVWGHELGRDRVELLPALKEASTSTPGCRKYVAPPAGFAGRGLPRRAVQMFDFGAGIVLQPNRGTLPEQARAAVIERLQPGDIVFFDADPDDNCNRSASVIDHVGIYLGQDDVDPAVPGRRPRPRFISSRKTVNGPTTHDVGGPSALDGDTHFGRGFVAARRF